MCIGCHGIAMYKTVFPEVYSVPMIAGQSPDYIVKALQAYRAGDRGHPSMQAIAKSVRSNKPSSRRNSAECGIGSDEGPALTDQIHPKSIGPLDSWPLPQQNSCR